MPVEMERALRKSARKKGIKEGSERWKAYVYGTLARWKKKHTKKGD